MEYQYLVVYLEILVMCFIVVSTIYFNMSVNFGSEREVTIFRAMCFLMLIALVVDGITHAQYRHAILLPNVVTGFCYSTYMFIMSGLFSYLWLLFAELRIDSAIIEKRNYFIIIAAIPIIIIFIISYASIWTGWFYQLDAAGRYSRGPYWVHQTYLTYIYYAITTFHALFKARKEKSRARKKELWTIAAFVTAPFIGVLLQLFVGSHPFVAPACCIALLLIFISFQGNMIHSDALTTLNNRKRTDKYLEEIVNHADIMPFYLYMLDIDHFKSINDTLGHLEGDKALRLVSSVLKRVTDEYHGFTGRFGGDEFVCIIDKNHIDRPEYLPEKINQELIAECKALKLDYQLKVSYGFTEANSKNMPAQDLLAEADYLLYKNKCKAEGV